MRGEGLRVRLRRIPGETPKNVLRSALILPAVMRGFSWTEEAQHAEYDTVRAGQFSQPAMGPATARQLRTVDDVETLTVEWDAPWLVEQGLDPDDVYRDLFAVLRSRRAVELLVTPKFTERSVLRMNVTIRRGAGRSTTLPTTHKLTADDTLHSLAQHYYHSALAAVDIARANGIGKWGRKTPLVKMHRFKVGSKVKIPKLVVASTNSPDRGD
jgi:hypothetical protein